MKFKNIAIAAAMVSGFTMSSAFALTPNAIDPQNPTANDIVIHYAGATAQKLSIQNLANDFCAAGTLDTYDNIATDPTHFVITCTLDNGVASIVPVSIRGMNLYFSYMLNGGSFNGVTPVTDQVPLLFMRVYNNATCATVAANSYTCANSGANQYAQAPQAGGSDVEPALFKGANIPAGQSAPSAAGLASTVTDQAFDVIFGIPVHCSKLNWTAYPECATSAFATGGGTQGPITTLSKSSIASIFAGNKIFWEQVAEYGSVDNNGNGVPDVEDLYTVGVPATPIHVCRRVRGSGTQASAQAYWVGQECHGFFRSFVTAATAAIPGEVEEISSSSSILSSCTNNNVNALAISSLEKLPGVDGNGDGIPDFGNNWTYVTIDGIAPTEQNAGTGKYDYMFENSLQYKSSVMNASQTTFITALFARAKDAASLVGKPGVLGIYDGAVNVAGDPADVNGNNVFNEWEPSNKVAWTSRGGQACKPSVQVYP